MVQNNIQMDNPKQALIYKKDSSVSLGFWWTNYF